MVVILERTKAHGSELGKNYAFPTRHVPIPKLRTAEETKKSTKKHELGLEHEISFQQPYKLKVKSSQLLINWNSGNNFRKKVH